MTFTIWNPLYLFQYFCLFNFIQVHRATQNSFGPSIKNNKIIIRSLLTFFCHGSTVYSNSPTCQWIFTDLFASSSQSKMVGNKFLDCGNRKIKTCDCSLPCINGSTRWIFFIEWSSVESVEFPVCLWNSVDLISQELIHILCCDYNISNFNYIFIMLEKYIYSFIYVFIYLCMCVSIFVSLKPLEDS